MTKRTGRGQNESAFTRWFCERLEKVNALTLVLAGGNVFQQAGLPDRYICHKRFRGWLEFKSGVNKLREGAQRLTCEALVERGDIVLLVTLSRGCWITIQYTDGREIAILDYTHLQSIGDPACGLEILCALEKIY